MKPSDSPDREALEFYLRAAQGLIRKQTEEIQKQAGFGPDVAVLRMLEELAKEQIPNEDAVSSARQTR